MERPTGPKPSQQPNSPLPPLCARVPQRPSPPPFLSPADSSGPQASTDAFFFHNFRARPPQVPAGDPPLQFVPLRPRSSRPSTPTNTPASPLPSPRNPNPYGTPRPLVFNVDLPPRPPARSSIFDEDLRPRALSPPPIFLLFICASF